MISRTTSKMDRTMTVGEYQFKAITLKEQPKIAGMNQMTTVGEARTMTVGQAKITIAGEVRTMTVG